MSNSGAKAASSGIHYERLYRSDRYFDYADHTLALTSPSTNISTPPASRSYG